MNISFQETGVYVFGPFRLDPTRRTLSRAGVAVPLTARLFDTLLYLVKNPHRLISREELESAVWGDRVIGEGNLQKAISSLRRALQEDNAAEALVATVPGRGFRFAMPVVFEPDGAGAPEAPAHVPAWRRYRLGLAFGALAILLAGAGVLYAVILRAPIGEAAFNPPPHSVAVLAFANMSGDPAQEYFSSGLSEELINTLSRIDALQVAARMSAFTFKDGKATIGEIGRKLNVGAVLEGSVRTSGNRLRVTAQLINAVTGYQYWSRTYDRDRGDVLQLETDIAEAVAQSLEVTLLGAEKANLTAGGTSNPLAFDAYLHGSSLIRTFDEPSVRAALAAFENAIRLDPGFADAHAGRAFALQTLWFVWPDDPTPRETEWSQALAEADKAVALAPQSARAHATRALILEWRLDLRGAEAEAKQAHAMDSGDIMVERVYVRIMSHHGYFREAEAAARHVVALDPLTAATYYQQAGILVGSRKYAEALTALHREQAIGTVNPQMTHELIAIAHWGLGDYRAVLLDCADSCGYEGLAYVAAADMKLGLVAEAKAAFVKLQSAPVDDNAMFNADVYAQWGEKETALHWLEVAFAHRSPLLCTMRDVPLLDPIRNTPRFMAIEQKLGFPPRAP